MNNDLLLAWLNDADAIGRQIEQARERFVNVVGALHRAPDAHAVAGTGHGEHPVRLDTERSPVGAGQPGEPPGHGAGAAADVHAGLTPPYVARGQHPRTQPLDRRHGS